jgi:hypothetical protein
MHSPIIKKAEALFGGVFSMGPCRDVSKYSRLFRRGRVECVQSGIDSLKTAERRAEELVGELGVR